MDSDAPRHVVIAGGTGFLGQSLARFLHARGDRVGIIGRSCPDTGLVGDFVPWDGRTLGDWVQALDGADAVVNLAGRSVDCIKTPDHRDEILRSRVESTRVIGKAFRSVPNPPRVWVQMSTAHIYGDPPTEQCDESSGFSWIHERDMNRIFDRAVSDPGMTGAYVATAPKPVSQAEFMRSLRKAMGVPIGLPAFRWMVRLGAPLVLRTDPNLALYGRYVVPTRLLDEGFGFEFATIDAAFDDLFA